MNTKIRDFVRDIRDYMVESNVVNQSYIELTDDELDWLVDELYNNWFDIRKTLDEQMIVNRKMYSNYYIYEARELVAKVKFLYAKAEQMIRVDKKNKI